MNYDIAHQTKLRKEAVYSMKDVRPEGAFGSQKILVNPLVARCNIHYDKGKYTLANSTFGVTESSASRRNDKVHYNPKFLNQNVYSKDNVHYNLNYLSENPYVSTTIHVNPNFVPRDVQAYSAYSRTFDNKNKYKYVRKESASVEPPVVTVKSEPKTASKYKLVYSTAPSAPAAPPAKPGFVIRSKYSLRTCQPASQPNSSSRVRYDFKISRNKLVRKSVLRGKKRYKRHSVFSLRNLIKNRTSSECGIFKKFSRTKIVRRSVLRAHIDSRKLLRKSLNSSVSNLLAIKPLINSKYKLVLKRTSKKPDTSLTKPNLNKSLFNKSKRRRSAIVKITSKLRKNNQHCRFYNRFGRCKGKDRGTCNQLHDPLYVSICKKLPFGECLDKSCLLSHDVRPGKMPTCYHYLAGICKRDKCPFLHIKVNPKAPICGMFLQGYCPDVYNCLKRHEYVCPIFAEKGSCPKGKSCAHPHRISTVHSKLLAAHQRPLMAKNAPSPSAGFLVSVDPVPPRQEPSEEPQPFTRYFSMPIPTSSQFQPPSSPFDPELDPQSQ